MPSRCALRFLAVCCLVFATSPLLFSQTNGTFSGTVTDKTGSVIAGANVTITSEATGVARQAKTDDSGHYTIPFLPVSVFTIKVDSPGFQPAELKEQRLQVNEQRELNFTLVPASVSEQVEVSGTAVAVETTNPTLGQVINQEQVSQLPLNGRNFVQLATLTPGTTQETNPNSFFNGAASSETSSRGTYSLSVGGSRAQSTDWLLDNNDNDELTSGGISILPTLDSMQEFKVLTYNYSAEYGTRAGPTVLVTTKSGTNKFHGALYEYFRNTKLDARSYFAAFREQFNLNQFGGSLGGPIQKDKTFFFFNYEAKRFRHGIPFIGLVPSLAMRAGDFSADPLGLSRPDTFDGTPNANGFSDLVNPYTGTPFQCSGGQPTAVLAGGAQVAGTACNVIPTTGGPTGFGLVDPIGLQMLSLYPTPTGADPNTDTNYANVPVRRLNEGNATVRLDHNFSSKDSAFARFSYDQANLYVPGGSPTWAEANPFGSNQLISNHGRNAVVSETHIFNANNINQLYVGYNRIFNHITSYGEFGGQLCKAANLGILGADLNSKCPLAPPGLTQTSKDCLSCGLSSTLMSSYWSLGDRGFAPFQGGTNVFTFSDTFAMIRGKHDVRIGAGIRINQMNVMTNGFQDGFFLVGSSFTGDNAGDLLLGQPFGAIHDQTFYGATTGRRWKMFRPFVQDDWRVTSNLTLNLGLAWALVTPITEAHNRQANFDWPTKQFLIAGNAPFNGCTNCVHSDSAAGIQFDKRAFEPRIGIAWKPFGSDKTAVRAGYAIYHDSAWSQGAQGLWQNPPYYAEVDNFNFGPPCQFGNSALAANDPNAATCGLKYGFLQSTPGGLAPFTSPPNPDSFTGGLLSQNRDFKQGTVQQFNLNIERQLPGNLVLTTGYAGTRSTHILFYGLNMNIDSPWACAGGPLATPGYTLGCGPGGAYVPAPYQSQFTNVQNVSDKGRAQYDSLQIKAETKSSRHGLYALLGYTWSRTFDSGLPDGDGTFPGAMYWPLPGTKKLDWGLSQLNLNDQFTASIIYDLPFGRGKHFGSGWSGAPNAVLGGWQINVIEKATSGFPLFIVDSFNNSGVNLQWNGSTLNRPNQICNPQLSHPTLSKWFDTSCFVPAAPGELGNAKRAPLYGPRFVNTDFSLVKNFAVRERFAVQFRAEFFNLLNHAQFYLGGGSTGMQDSSSPSSFGVVNGTVNNPRVVQLALRLDF